MMPDRYMVKINLWDASRNILGNKTIYAITEERAMKFGRESMIEIKESHPDTTLKEFTLFGHEEGVNKVRPQLKYQNNFPEKSNDG